VNECQVGGFCPAVCENTYGSFGCGPLILNDTLKIMSGALNSTVLGVTGQSLVLNSTLGGQLIEFEYLILNATITSAFIFNPALGFKVDCLAFANLTHPTDGARRKLQCVVPSKYGLRWTVGLRFCIFRDCSESVGWEVFHYPPPVLKPESLRLAGSGLLYNGSLDLPTTDPYLVQ
jgi:hypothetical protein